MARARIYIRRSDDDQSTWSPEAQERQNRLYCELHGHEVIRVYIDDDLTGTREDRAAFQQLITEAKRDPGSLVIIHKIDRLARDAEVVLRTIKEFDKFNVTLVSVSEQIDFSTPIGRVMLTNLAAFAEYYSRNLATEVRKGLREKAEQGGWIGPAPLGYRHNGDTLAITEDSETVRLIFWLYGTSSYSDATLRDVLNERGLTVIDIHTGERRPFQRDSVGGILRNPAYVGLVRCGNKTYPGKHEALIDQALYDRCQDIRQRRTKTKIGRIASANNAGLLLEIGFCACCDGRLHLNSSGSLKQPYYRCSTRRRYGDKACSSKMIGAERANEWALDLLRGLAIPEHIKTHVIDFVRSQLGQPRTERKISTQSIQEQLRRLKRAYLAGDTDLTDEIYFRERDRLSRLLTEQPAPPYKILDVTKALDILSDISRLISEANQEQQRGLVQQIFRRIWLNKNGLVAIEPAGNYKLLMEASRVVTATSTGLSPADTTYHLPIWQNYQVVWT